MVIREGPMRPRIALLAVGFALLGVAWIVATAPFGAPDEAAHYLRALNITNGHILGPKVRYAANPLLSPAEISFAQGDTRGVVVPARLAPPNIPCQNGRPDVSGSCLAATYEGNFPPLPYLLPAVALGVSHHVSTALWLARLASVLQSVAFLLLAVCLLWRGTAWSVLGLLVAVTPMVLFVSSVLNPSGLEITSGLAFAASVLRITGAPAAVPRWCWAAFAISGFVVVVAWPLGLAFAFGDLALFTVLLDRAGRRELRQLSSQSLWLSGIVLTAAGAVWLIYSHVSGLGSGRFQITPLWEGIRSGLGQLSPVLHDAIGHFGALTVSLPAGAYRIWWLLIVLLVAAALWLGNSRERVLIAAVVGFEFAFVVLFHAWFGRFTGFGLQGRELLPALIVTPLLAGEIVYRHRDSFARSRAPQRLLAGVILLTATFQGYAWWFSARVAANAPGTIRFYAHASWKPPLGWIPWIALASLGTLALVCFAGTVLIGGQPAHGSERPGVPVTAVNES